MHHGPYGRLWSRGVKGIYTEWLKGDSYTVGISQFAEHGSLDNCREGFLEGLKEEGIEEGKTLRLITRMHRQIPVRQALLQTASYLRRLI